MKPSILVALLCLGLSACGPVDNDPGPGGVTVGEARALDEAAEMLDARNASAENGDRPAAAEKPTSEQ